MDNEGVERTSFPTPSTSFLDKNCDILTAALVKARDTTTHAQAQELLRAPMGSELRKAERRLNAKEY